MSRVTVVIPTAARPQTLEIALRSVARQTAVSQVERVLVSENLGDMRSRAVCARFPELPIDYVFREPCFGTMMEHAAQLFREVESEYVAFLCDDDIWAPGHIESALASLGSTPEAVAHFSGFLAAESELATHGDTWAAALLWLAAGRPDRYSEYVYSADDVLALAWVVTPFQWSTLVAESAAAAKSASALTEAPHFYYADRLFITAIAQTGSTIFDPAIDTVYRVYEGNWAAGQSSAKMRALHAECEAIIERKAAEAGLSLTAVWRDYLSDLNEEVAREAVPWLTGRFSRAELIALGFEPHLPEQKSIVGRVWQRLNRAAAVLRGAC